jgi:hypothetical protein
VAVDVTPRRDKPTLLPSHRTAVIVSVLLGSSLAATGWAIAAGRTLGYVAAPPPGSFPAAPTMGVFAAGVFLAAAAALLKPSSRLPHVVTVVVLGFSLVAPAVVSPAPLIGDASEYYQMASAFVNHGTPAIGSGDTRDVVTKGVLEGWVSAPSTEASLSAVMAGAILPSLSGERYSIHFWLSSLAVVPLAYLAKATNTPWLRSFQVFNALLILLAFYGLLFWSGFRDVKSQAFAAFWILSPVTWYLAWPSAEVWSASLVVLSIVLFTRRRYAWATLLAALAATQNPPLIVFVVLISGVGAYFVWKESGHRAVWVIGLAACVSFLPNAFYFATFRTLNLIAKIGGASPRFITGAKVLSLFVDLNQGVLPFAPVLMVLWVVAIGLSVYRRSWFGVALALATLLMAALAAMTPNWNSGAIGIMRYAIWLLPVMAWNVLAALRPARKWERWAVYALVAGQGLMAVTVLLWPPYVSGYLNMSPAAMYVLEHVPQAYTPVPEVFVERSVHTEASVRVATANPVALQDERGRVLKVLMSAPQVAVVANTLQLSPDRVRTQMYSAGEPGLYYFDVPVDAAQPFVSSP